MSEVEQAHVGTVVAIEGDTAVVRFQRGSICQKWQAGLAVHSFRSLLQWKNHRFSDAYFQIKNNDRYEADLIRKSRRKSENL